jgi:hypothetical protein
MATESFTAANGTDVTALSGGSVWAYTNGSSGKLFVTSNSIRAILNDGIFWSARYAGTFTNDQYAQIKLVKFASNSWVGVTVRADTSGNNYYLNARSSEYYLWKTVNYTPTLLKFDFLSFSLNDILRLEVSGNTLTCKKNGTAFFTTTDTSLVTGNPGVGATTSSSTDYTAGDDWEGDNLSTTALISIDSDNVINSNQTNVIAVGTGFGASQGAGTVTLRQSSVSVAQAIDSWADTSIQFDTTILATGADIKHGGAIARVTSNTAVFGELSILVNPPTGQIYTDLTSIATSAPERITAFPDLVSGDQLWIRGVGDTAAPTGLTVNPDASFFFEEGTTPADFEVRVWDSSDATWGDWSSFGFLSSLVGATSVGTVITDPVTIVVLTGNAATAYLANVDPGLETTITGIQITGSAGVVTIDTGSVFVVTGVVGTSQLAKLNIWNTIISSQAPNWVVIVT